MIHKNKTSQRQPKDPPHRNDDSQKGAGANYQQARIKPKTKNTKNNSEFTMISSQNNYSKTLFFILWTHGIDKS